MNGATLPIDVMIFELRRSLKPGRIAIWVVLAAFPIAIMTAMITIARIEMEDNFEPAKLILPFGMAMFFLIPGVTCVLGMLLWATPAISTEIEGQTWVYLATRAAGRRAVLIGKYLTSIVWTLSAAIAATSVCCFIVGPTIGHELWGVICLLSILSCAGYAAVFVVIGSLFYRRTMVAAVLYTVVVEGVVSFIPAVINKITIHYRLRGLLADWMQWDEARSEAEEIFGNEPASTHLTVLAVTVVVLLGFALYRVQNSEYPTEQEG